MQSRTVAVCLGIALNAYLPSLNASIIIAAGCCLLMLIGLVWARLCRRYITWLLLFTLGLAYGCFYGHQLLERRLDIALEDKVLTIDGEVTGLPVHHIRHGEPLTRFSLAVSSSQPATSLKKLLISWPQAPEVVPGQRWQLKVKARQPRGLQNPAGFDYQAWLVQQGVDATALVLASEGNQLLGEASVSVDKWRWHLAESFSSYQAEVNHLALLKALLIADKRDVEQHQWRRFSDTGTIHLLVISGIHIAIIALLGFYTGRLMGLLIYPGAIVFLSCVFSIGFATAYAAAAGFSLPTQRALIMVGVYVGSLLLQRNIAIKDRLLLAILCCLLHDPLAVISSSFWLSFVAVMVILYFCSGRKKQSANAYALLSVASLLRAQWAIFIGLTPLLLLQFNQAPLLAALINLVAIPLFSFVLIPLAFIFMLLHLLGLTVVAAFILKITDVCLGWFLSLVEVSSEAFAPFFTVSLPWYVWALAVIAVAVWMLPRFIPGRYLSLVLLLPVFSHGKPSTEIMQVTVFDVGQGLSILLETNAKTLLYDVGASWPNGSMAELVVLPYLKSRGINKLDVLVVSHKDNDHAGGVGAIAQGVELGHSFVGEPLPNSKLTQQRCAQQSWRWGDVSFQFMSVELPEVAAGNNQSCILKVEAAGIRLLLPGDIERKAEAGLLATQAQGLRAEVLIAPHHGSLSSSSWPFIKQVKPDYVIYSSGYKNQFGHPHSRVVNRYQALGATMYNTALSGAVAVKIDKHSGLTLNSLRQHKSYYWQ